MLWYIFWRIKNVFGLGERYELAILGKVRGLPAGADSRPSPTTIPVTPSLYGLFNVTKAFPQRSFHGNSFSWRRNLTLLPEYRCHWAWIIQHLIFSFLSPRVAASQLRCRSDVIKVFPSPPTCSLVLGGGNKKTHPSRARGPNPRTHVPFMLLSISRPSLTLNQ